MDDMSAEGPRTRADAQHARREAELQELLAAAQDLTRIRDVEHALRTVTDRTKRLLDCDVAYLSARVEDADHFAVRAWSGLLSPAFLGTRVSLGSGVGGAVAATRQAVQVEDYTRAPEITHNDYLDAHVGEEGLRALLGVPLEIDGHLLGILFAGRRTAQTFGDREIALVTSLAAHAAVALQNAQLFEAQAATMRDLEQSTALLREHTAAVETSVEVHEQLTQLVLHGEGVEPIVEVVAQALHVPVVFVDEAGLVVAGHGEPAPAPPFNAAVRDTLDRSRRSGRSASTTGPDGRRWYAGAAASGSTSLGALILSSQRELTDVEVRTFERATQTVSVSRLADAAMAQADTRAAAETVRRLLDPTRSSPEELDRVARRHQLATGPVTAAVATSVPDRTDAMLSALSARCHRDGGLSALLDDHLVALVPGPPEQVAEELHRLLTRAAGSSPTLSAAGPAATALDLQQRHREATQCLALMHQLGRERTWGTTSEFGIYAMLFTTDSAASLQHVIGSRIGPLLDYDARHSTELVETAATFLESGSSPSAAAAVLGVHTNTVSQRIGRIDRLLGPGWRRAPEQLDVQTALRLERLRRGGTTSHRASST